MLLTPQDCIERYADLYLKDEHLAVQGLKRRGWVIRDIPNPENVAEHSISTALMVPYRFHEKVKALGLDIETLQDTLLIHDIQEPVPGVGDITPHDNVPPHEKKKREIEAIHHILHDKPTLLQLWMNYENGRTPEGRFAMELDKLQAIEQARFYENQYGIPLLTREFYTYAIITKRQIQTRFLLDYAEELMTNPPLVVISHFPILENNPHESLISHQG